MHHTADKVLLGPARHAVQPCMLKSCVRAGLQPAQARRAPREERGARRRHHLRDRPGLVRGTLQALCGRPIRGAERVKPAILCYGLRLTCLWCAVCLVPSRDLSASAVWLAGVSRI